jgi:hypothetical protein
MNRDRSIMGISLDLKELITMSSDGYTDRLSSFDHQLGLCREDLALTGGDNLTHLKLRFLIRIICSLIPDGTGRSSSRQKAPMRHWQTCRRGAGRGRSSTETFEPGSTEGAARGEEGVQDFERKKVGSPLL